MKTVKAGLLAATVMFTAAAAEARCDPREIAGNWTVQVQGFGYDRNYGCEYNEQGCGFGGHFISTCTLRVSRNSATIANVNISCGRSIPSDWSPRPFNVQCIDGCPHHQLHAVGRNCEWDLIDLNGDVFFGDIIYRVTFSRDRQSFVGSGAAGPHSDVDHDGRSGVAASLVGIRR